MAIFNYILNVLIQTWGALHEMTHLILTAVEYSSGHRDFDPHLPGSKAHALKDLCITVSLVNLTKRCI